MTDLTPPGFIGFAMHWPGEVVATEPASAPMLRWPTISRINDVVNRRIEWSAPVAGETWKVCSGPDHGPCFDFAVTKRHDLVAAGIPAGALSLAWLHRVEDADDVDHMVLLLRVDGGGVYVLDSLTDYVATPRFDDDYQWKSRQAWGDPMRWVAMDDPA